MSDELNITEDDANLAHWLTRRMEGGDRWMPNVQRLLARHRLAALEQGAIAMQEAAAKSVEFSVNKGTADHCIRGLNPAAIVKASHPTP